VQSGEKLLNAMKYSGFRIRQVKRISSSWAGRSVEGCGSTIGENLEEPLKKQPCTDDVPQPIVDVGYPRMGAVTRDERLRHFS
jgi:hypothetical protein